MAGIFNLFGEMSEPDKGSTTKLLSRSKTSLGINNVSVKTVAQSKPKGLSIRSNSDLNVPASLQDIPNKQELLKPKLTQLDNGGRPISPKKELLSKKLIGTSNKIKDASPKKVFDRKNMKLSDESIFKRPLTPKFKKLYPEPESLAPYCDMQAEFDDIYTKIIEEEFKDLLVKKKNEVVPYEDEGFHSDPEEINFNMPEFRVSPKLYIGEIVPPKTPDLPQISDDDDGNF